MSVKATELGLPRREFISSTLVLSGMTAAAGFAGLSKVWAAAPRRALDPVNPDILFGTTSSIWGQQHDIIWAVKRIAALGLQGIEPAMRKSTIAPLVLMLCCLVAFSQEPQRPEGLRQIIPGHYVFTSGAFNSGVISTSEGVLVLDALNSEPVGRAERKAIEDTIRQPVRALVSSTFHDNYSKGNVAYADVWKIGHENYRTDLVELMQREKVPAEEQKARLPNQTFRDRITL